MVPSGLPKAYPKPVRVVHCGEGGCPFKPGQATGRGFFMRRTVLLSRRVPGVCCSVNSTALVISTLMGTVFLSGDLTPDLGMAHQRHPRSGM
jgi:hypothetical protein